MGVLSAVAVAEIKARGSINDADVLRLRRNYDDEGRISAEEAETILALNSACPVQDPAWAGCFVETITDYLVEREIAATEPGIARQRDAARRCRVTRGSHHRTGDRLDEQVGPGRVIVGRCGRLVDVEQHLGLGLGDGEVAIAAEGTKH